MHLHFIHFLLLITPIVLDYTQDSFQREARASECSLQRAREGTSPYPTCCYARYCFKFECALPHGSGGRGVDELLVVGDDDALV